MNTSGVRTWTSEEDAWLKECGDKVLAQSLTLTKDLPMMFREKFDTHTNLAIVVRYENKFKPKPVKKESEEVDTEESESKKEARFLQKYITERRRFEDKMAEKRKMHQALREERLKKMRASFGGYSVG